MRSILVIWMCLIVAVGFSIEFRDVHGVLHETDGNNVIIVIGNTNCPAMDNMIRFQLAGLKDDYPDVLALVVFPCIPPLPESVKAWQTRVPGASNFCPVEIDARTIHPLLTAWQDMGYPQYGGFVYGKSGACITNWNYWRSRYSVEVPLTRQLNDLHMIRSNGIPVPTWRKTKPQWQLRQKDTFYWLELPN